MVGCEGVVECDRGRCLTVGVVEGGVRDGANGLLGSATGKGALRVAENCVRSRGVRSGDDGKVWVC